jgi:hypothetical protein
MGVNPQLAREIRQGDQRTGNTLIQVNGADPAAGAEVSQTVPAGKWWGLQAVSIPLVQGITDTPQPILVIDDGTDVIMELFGATTVQAVSTTCRYNWAPGLPLSGLIGSAANVHATAPLPEDLILAPGYRIRTVTLGLTATGNYGVPSFYVAEYS